MAKCPHCQTKLPMEANFCMNCGAEIKANKSMVGKRSSQKRRPLRKLKTLLKIDDDGGVESDPEVLKPEVMSLPTVSEAVALQLPVLQECVVCQGEIPAGEIFIRCYCELITHVECVSDEQICPQCGRELDLELMLPKGYEKKKRAPKKPTILKADKREIEELTPPAESYFAHVPEITKEDRIKNFMTSYYDKHNMGRLTRTKNASDIDMFISETAAKKMLDHCYEQGREKEVMGLILGETFQHNKKLFSIVKDVATSELDATQVKVKFKSFEKLFEHLENVSYDYQIVGWYHSHPGHTSFMSETDVDTQERMFNQPHQCAIVIDPINYDMKAFTLDKKEKKRVKESGFAIIDFKD